MATWWGRRRRKSPVKADLQELGLVSGFLLGRHFFGLEDLHYGYWTPGIPVDIHHLAQAQRQYSDFLLSHLPTNVRSVLDVGCGTGSVARRLIDSGCTVDCVSPSPFLTPYALQRLGDEAVVYRLRFEELELTKTYDLVLFCESFQYMPYRVSLERALGLLRPGGHVVICDFFRLESAERSPIGGGHRWREFQQHVATLPLECVTNLDITPQTAPTMALVNDAMSLSIRPIWEMTQQTFAAHYPRSARFVRWLLRRRLERIEMKQLAGLRTPEAFAAHKSYRLLIYRKRAAGAVATTATRSAA